jgi:Glucodextranase, domain B
MSRRRRRLFLVAVCCAAAGVAACGSSSSKKESASAASVQVTSPADGSATRSDRVTVRGTVTPPDATVLVVGQAAQVGNGVFTIAIPLHKGQNTIDVVASAKGVTPASTKVVVTRTSSSTGTKKSTRKDSGTRSASGPVLAGARNCGSGVTAGANTSCPFAQNVVEAYAATGSGVLDVRSPVTGQTYRMFCTGGTVHVCTGGNNASVYFGNTGAYSLGNCGGDLSAGPSTSCGFAENVRAAYRESRSSVVTAFSPATGKTYTMYCTTSSPHVCTGGNDAAVYFP